MSLRDDINIPVVVVLGITTSLIVAVAIIGTRAGYNYVTQVDLERNYKYAAERGLLHYGEGITKKQKEAINKPGLEWVSPVPDERSAARMPLDDAMQLMVDLKGNPPTK